MGKMKINGFHGGDNEEEKMMIFVGLIKDAIVQLLMMRIEITIVSMFVAPLHRFLPCLLSQRA